MFVQMVKRLGVGPKWGNGGFLGSFVILEGFGINHGVWFQCSSIPYWKEELPKNFNNNEVFLENHRGACVKGHSFGRWSIYLVW